MNDLTPGEYSDWRLANKNELWSLIRYGHWDSSSWLFGQGFEDVQSGSYWTSMTFADDTSRAWVIYMESGNTVSSSSAKTKAGNYAWAVRGGQRGTEKRNKSGGNRKVLIFGQPRPRGNTYWLFS